MLNVLINAYAVSPNWGSEPGLGWNWVVNLSKYCNVFVITEGEWKNEIEEAIQNLPQCDNIHFYYNPVSPKIRNMCWDQGDWRFYKYYRQWQEKALDIAKDIISDNRIDIIHQLNMIGFREPGSLWKIEGIPFIWGPVGGYGWTTLKYLKGQPLGVKFKSTIKNIINIIQGKIYPLSNNAMKRASCVMAANSNVYMYIKENFRKDVILLNETGCYEKNVPLSERKYNQEFNILWVGKFDYRKQLELAIRSVSQLGGAYPFIKLNIVGDNDNSTYSRLSKLCSILNIEHNVVWHGKIPNKKVHQLMQESDIFLFTSIDEGTPHVVLESIQNNLPIVCFDTCGQGDVVNDSVGIKIPLSNATQSPSDFARAISSLINDRKKLHQMRINCSSRQKELSWDTKIQKVVSIYDQIISQK
ncbi:glycosyltransferase [Bacteroides acidifaciens]|uniref:glycosyltransferase family 4 protein n=1 Tax=Bacteroides acidifaciens TaxID=85831 RepID=UPI000F47BF5D|nr:glycosyltransferase [Bacteroides acidifaciens]ROT17583.1 glycosyltransferase [Muribaculaceae bacterium Isolate-110 (HZI)]